MNTSNKILHHYISTHVKQHSNTIAILSDHLELSYKTLHEQINCIVRKLRKYNVSKQDRVAVIIPQVDMAVACVAVSTGAICVPLNPSYKPDELKSYLKQLKIKALLANFEAHSFLLDIAKSLDITILAVQFDPEKNIIILC